jgi:hypothetical protein
MTRSAIHAPACFPFVPSLVVDARAVVGLVVVVGGFGAAVAGGFTRTGAPSPHSCAR